MLPRLSSGQEKSSPRHKHTHLRPSVEREAAQDIGADNQRRHKLFISHAQFEELSRVLDYPKFEFEDEQKLRFKALVSAIATFVDVPARLDIVKEDPADNVILECAMAARADFIVSGDEHPLSLGKVDGTRIVTANDFLKAG